MMIAARNAFLMGGAKLPYDAEVEYLESTGTQYIDTGVIFTPTSAVAMRIAYTHISTSDTDAQHNGFTKGSDSGNFRIIFGQNSEHNHIYAAALTKYITADTALHTFAVDLVSRTARIDTSSSSISGSLTGGFTRSFYIFARNTDGVANLFCHERVYAATFLENGVLVRDFIPVRVGSGSSAVGCLYDRANPTGGPLGNGLYPNAGTGAFVIGPDK